MGAYAFHMIDQRRRPNVGKFVLWFLVMVAAIAVDQATKFWVMGSYSLGQFQEVTSFFNLCYVRNTGAAFSFLSTAGGWQVWAFGALAVLVSLGCLAWLTRCNHKVLLSFALALIAAGAIGNFIDRAAFGSVCDFLDFHWNEWHWPAFNVADICITLGAVFFILAEFFDKDADR